MRNSQAKATPKVKDCFSPFPLSQVKRHRTRVLPPEDFRRMGTGLTDPPCASPPPQARGLCVRAPESQMHFAALFDHSS
jgi:hypothetical protein